MHFNACVKFLLLNFSNFWRERLSEFSRYNLVFTSDASTSASTNTSNRDDPSKTKFDATTSTSKTIRTFRYFRKLPRREVIRVQCFQWPNTTSCSKYPCVCVMPKRYFVITCFSANAGISAITRKKKFLILALVLMSVSRLFSRWNENHSICACICACAYVASENQA